MCGICIRMFGRGKCERFTLPKYKMLCYCLALTSRCKEIILLDGVAYSFVAVVRMVKALLHKLQPFEMSYSVES